MLPQPAFMTLTVALASVVYADRFSLVLKETRRLTGSP